MAESVFCNLFIFKEKQRQIQIQRHMKCIYNFTQTKYIAESYWDTQNR